MSGTAYDLLMRFLALPTPVGDREHEQLRADTLAFLGERYTGREGIVQRVRRKLREAGKR